MVFVVIATLTNNKTDCKGSRLKTTTSGEELNPDRIIFSLLKSMIKFYIMYRI